MDGRARPSYGRGVKPKQPDYLKEFPNVEAARSWMRFLRSSNGVKGWNWVVATGPSDRPAVMDLRSAIELGGGYEF